MFDVNRYRSVTKINVFTTYINARRVLPVNNLGNLTNLKNTTSILRNSAKPPYDDDERLNRYEISTSTRLYKLRILFGISVTSWKSNKINLTESSVYPIQINNRWLVDRRGTRPSSTSFSRHLVRWFKKRGLAVTDRRSGASLLFLAT